MALCLFCQLWKNEAPLFFGLGERRDHDVSKRRVRGLVEPLNLAYSHNVLKPTLSFFLLYTLPYFQFTGVGRTCIAACFFCNCPGVWNGYIKTL